MSRNYYTSGQWNLICDVCGKKIKSGKSRHRWDGFVVCEDDWEERHQQDFVKARVDKITVPFLRPRPVDVFVNVDYYEYWDLGYTMDGYIDGDNV